MSAQLSLKTNHLIVDGETRFIGSVAKEVLWLLMGHSQLSTKQLIANVYPDSSRPKTAPDCIRVAILTLRIALFQSGWCIRCCRTRGYFLERDSKHERHVDFATAQL